MFVHVERAKYIGGYKIWLAFNDGAECEIDLSSELDGEIFITEADQLGKCPLPVVTVDTRC